jgi:hypothetical protein
MGGFPRIEVQLLNKVVFGIFIVGLSERPDLLEMQVTTDV